MEPKKDFHLQVEDRVVHVKDASWIGTIKEIDWNLIPEFGVTTCRVEFDDNPGVTDVQWTNKLSRLS
jgi:hypothetical protein